MTPLFPTNQPAKAATNKKVGPNLRFALGVFIGATAVLALGQWRVPDRKAQIESDVLYSWLTGADRRVDLAVQDSQFVLYVSTKDKRRDFFQVVVHDDDIQTYHSLHYGNPPVEAEDGVKLDSKAGKITIFTARLGVGQPLTLLRDTNDDLKFDTLIAPGKRQTIEWSYSPMPVTTEDKTAAPEVKSAPAATPAAK